jgi:hypothetical protein
MTVLMAAPKQPLPWHCAWCNPGSLPAGQTAGICAACLERELRGLRDLHEVGGHGPVDGAGIPDCEGHPADRAKSPRKRAA